MVVCDSQRLGATYSCDREKFRVAVSTSIVKVAIEQGSLWCFDRDYALEQFNVLNESLFSEILLNGRETLGGYAPSQRIATELCDVVVSHSEGKDPTVDAQGPEGLSLMPPITRTISLQRFAPVVITSRVDIMRAALEERVRSFMRQIGDVRDGALVVVPETNDLATLISERIQPEYRSQAMAVYSECFDDIPDIARRVVLAAVSERLEQVVVPHKFKIMDVDSRSPIRGGEIRVIVSTGIFQEVVEEVIAPQSVPVAMQELERQASMLKSGQSGKSDEDGFFTIYAPADATVDFEVVSPSHHFIKHRFAGLQLKPRSEESSLFLPADTIGVFVSNLQREKRQEVVQ